MLECERIVRASCSLGFEDAEVSQPETASNEREPLADWGEVIRRDERERQASSTAHFSSGAGSNACANEVGLDEEEPMTGSIFSRLLLYVHKQLPNM